MTGFDPLAISVGGEWWKYFKSKHAGRGGDSADLVFAGRAHGRR